MASKTVTKKEGQKQSAPKPAPREEFSFKMLVIIIEHGRAEEMVEILAQQKVMFHLVCMGDGTADSALLQLLNLDQSDKDVIINIIESNKVEAVIKCLYDSFEGSGIIFTVKLSSIGGRKTLQLLQGDLSAFGKKE